ncbi:MAG TPA: SlyX family protein [Woeseiaceae bacterium]
MSEERFIDLESRLAQLDHLLHQLNEVVSNQQAQIMRLEEVSRTLADRIRSLGDGAGAGDSGDERPPHY